MVTIKGTRVSAKRNDLWITRNVSHFLKLRGMVLPSNNSPDVNRETDSDTDIDDTEPAAQQQALIPQLPAADQPAIAP